MKRAILYIIFFSFGYCPGKSQEIIKDRASESNEAIQQIRTSGEENILNFQTLQILNRGIGSYSFIQQTGNRNKVNINQFDEAGSSTVNQSFTIQKGSSNEVIVGQMGGGNLLFGFQLGYLARLAERRQGVQIGIDKSAIPAMFSNVGEGDKTEGEGNKLNITQAGNSNGAMTSQQGFYNFINAKQQGINNYLSILQYGTNNSVTNYKQGNESELILFDTIIQIGDNLSLTTDGVTNSNPAVNRFTQTGANLSIQLNNSLLNTGTGVNVNQTGHDMKVVIDQSYFSFPFGKP